MVEGQSLVRLEEGWKLQLQEEFQKSYMLELKNFLRGELSGRKRIYPRGAEYFNAFNSTPFHRVKVVILGQDPSPRPRTGPRPLLLRSAGDTMSPFLDKHHQGDPAGSRACRSSCCGAPTPTKRVPSSTRRSTWFSMRRTRHPFPHTAVSWGVGTFPRRTTTCASTAWTPSTGVWSRDAPPPSIQRGEPPRCRHRCPRRRRHSTSPATPDQTSHCTPPPNRSWCNRRSWRLPVLPPGVLSLPPHAKG